MKNLAIGNKFARPTRRQRGSKYDVLLDAALELEPGGNRGIVETFETAEEANKAINGLRGRRIRRGLSKAVDIYIAADGVSLVLVPVDQSLPADEEAG